MHEMVEGQVSGMTQKMQQKKNSKKGETKVGRSPQLCFSSGCAVFTVSFDQAVPMLF